MARHCCEGLWYEASRVRRAVRCMRHSSSSARRDPMSSLLSDLLSLRGEAATPCATCNGAAVGGMHKIRALWRGRQVTGTQAGTCSACATRSKSRWRPC